MGRGHLFTIQPNFSESMNLKYKFSKAIPTAGVFFIMASALIGCDLISSGPSKLIAFGHTRPVSCSYEGSFLGGAGYDCVVRNHSEAIRKVSMECASFDANGRMMGSTDRVAGLHNAKFNPGEERINRFYFHKDSKVAICSEIRNSIPTVEDAFALVGVDAMRELNGVIKL